MDTRQDPRALEVVLDTDLRETPAGKMLLSTFTRSRRQYWNSLRLAYAILSGQRMQHIDPRQAMRYPWHRWTENDARQFRAQVEDRIGRQDEFRISAATANRVLVVVRQILRTSGVWTEGHAQALKAISFRNGKRRKPLSEAEQRRLFRTILRKGSAISKRDAAMLAVALGAGLRVSEIASLPMSAYERPYLTVSNRKGRVDQTFKLASSACKILDRWLEVRGEGEYMFPAFRKGDNIQDGHMSHQAVQNSIQQRLGEAKMNSRTVHDLRATFVQTIADRNGVHVAQQAAGHADLKTTERYLTVKQEQLDRATEGAPVKYYEWAK